MIKKYSDKSEITFILDNLRFEDKQELFFHLGKNWKQKTLQNLINKEILVLYGPDNTGKQVPIAMGGFCGLDGDNSIACVWLLCSFYIYKSRVALTKGLKENIASAEQKYKIMYNFIYKSNFEAKGWLKKLGFKFDNPHPKGMDVKEDFE
ncbi:MAG: hypothetical protein LUH05_10355, partial [Candidatus Gastranaerophilales bacterium]|nr:hypothetical protein [Candidatus Gastranaerophilales bacterium]